MSPDPVQDYRPYRVTLGALYIGLVTLAVAWLLSSVGVALFIRPTPRVTRPFSGAPSDVDGILACQSDVEHLFSQLNDMLGRIPTGGAEEARLNQEFKEIWPEAWRTVGATCRFDELRDHGMGAAYDHLAWVHAELEGLHRGYAALLESYIAQHEARVNGIRHALDASRRTLERTRAPHPG